MVRLALILLFALVMNAACQSGKQQDEDNHFKLSGRFEHEGPALLYFEELTPNDLIPIDTIYTDHSGNFTYTGSIDEAGFYIIRHSPSDYIRLLIAPGEEILLTGIVSDLPGSYSVEGSPGSQLLLKLQRKLDAGYARVDSLVDVFESSRHLENFSEIRRELNAGYKNIVSDQQRYVKRFIRKNHSSLASIIALYQHFGNQLLLDQTEHLNYFQRVSNTLSEAYPTNKHVLDLNRRVSNHDRKEGRRGIVHNELQPGDKAPEIIMPSPDGEMIALSSLRGNYVLIDFWASWCTPCRKANPKLKLIYDTYHSKGFEIYGISLDRTREQWLQGIQEDDINWTQVSDLRFWNSPVISLYNISGISDT
ncbi:MAG: TlpA disulfide reductase family protein [Bacteroidales bacterium]|nr:TlpA disulfide reductase family protein [Bacteroidales bacterium]